MNARGIVALLAVQGLLGASALAQAPGSPLLKEEAVRQNTIYQSRGENVPTGYVLDRSLAYYTSALPREFEVGLASLNKTDRWMDIGAGMGHAILDYHGSGYDVGRPEYRIPGNKAQAVAVSIEDRRTNAWHEAAAKLEPNRIIYHHGKPLENYSLAELGKFHIITDFIGGFSYAPNLSRFLEKALSFLHTGGSFYTILQDVHSEAGANQPFYAGSPYLTEINQTDGSKLKVCAWLKNISCVQVTCELKTGWRPPVEVYRVHKTCDNVTVPQLTPTHYAAGTPPERRYLLLPPLPTPAPAVTEQASNAR
ncbi:MAG: class I SAM-dependent methyltransferase [Betaproteobacteria bacterium]|nr:class I SAM-dependent methyltransferase [Betaproteobacteria bacterium]